MTTSIEKCPSCNADIYRGAVMCVCGWHRFAKLDPIPCNQPKPELAKQAEVVRRLKAARDETARLVVSSQHDEAMDARQKYAIMRKHSEADSMYECAKSYYEWMKGGKRGRTAAQTPYRRRS